MAVRGTVLQAAVQGTGVRVVDHSEVAGAVNTEEGAVAARSTAVGGTAEMLT